MNKIMKPAILLLISIAPIVHAQTFTYVGPPNGDFVDELNWEDGGGANPANGSIDPSTDITLDLVINGDAVSSPDIDFDGSLTLNAGSVLTINAGEDLDMDPGSTLNLIDATLNSGDDIFIGGVANLTGGSITAALDDIEFQGAATVAIDGTSLTANGSGATIEFLTPNVTIANATFETTRFVIESPDDGDDGTPGNLVAVNSTFNVSGSANDADGNDAGTLTLQGDSSFSVSALEEGFDLLADNDSDVVLNGLLDGTFTGDYLGDSGDDGQGASVTLLSLGSSVSVPAVVLNPATGILDPRAFIVNGLTGLTYFEDPSTWNVTDWNGVTAETLRIVSGIGGPINGDTPGRIVPEPAALLTVLSGASLCLVRRKG